MPTPECNRPTLAMADMTHSADIPAPHVRPLLTVRGLCAGYEQTPVLRGISFDLAPGELVALLGRNGSGRSTLARALMGLLPVKGSVLFAGVQTVGWPAHRIARLGLGYVPENRDVFPTLTVQQNLLLGQKPSPLEGAAWREDDMYALFPPLRERQHTLAGVLSGGEQQMLSLCRSLMGNPQLLIIDEPTEGLAPQWVQAVRGFLGQLKARGVTVLLIEQKLAIALDVADRVLLMGRGEIVFDGKPSALEQNSAVRREWLEV